MTTERDELIVGFLTEAGWSTATRICLAGDASMRRYERLRLKSGKTAVLMDAPPDTNADISLFANIARYLCEAGFSAPQIYAGDVVNGLLLLEDLGDDLFARVIPSAPTLEQSLYEAATDVLIALHRGNPPLLRQFGPELMAKQASLVFETWIQAINGSHDAVLSQRFQTRFQDLLRQTTHGSPVMILRDYHAENLLWLPGRTGLARVGLLDFQDAMLAHPAYDLASLLQDVRRDVPAVIEHSMIARYIALTGQDEVRFRTAYAVIGVQRNLRILAVFARLARNLGKPNYASLIPRAYAHVMRGLQHPDLAPIAGLLIDALPAPTGPNLQKLVAA